ncbi:MAG: adenosylcobinamide-GDP ribazoletransferase [Victivallales bacterium]|jgi:cobalamin synthase
MERTWLGALVSAWNLLLEIPFPNIGLWNEDEEPEGDSIRTLACFPIVGALIGYAAYCIIWILSRFQSLTAAAAVSAILIVIGIEMMTLGKSFNALVAFFEAKIEGLRELELVAAVEKEPSFCKTPLGLMFFLSVFILKIACVSLLVYYERTSWLIVTMAVSYAVIAKMATSRDLRTSQPFFETEEVRAEKLAWLFAGAISFIVGWSYSPAVIIVLVLAYFLSGKFKIHCENEFGGVTGKFVGMTGAAAETLVLLAGVILLVRL